MEGSAAAAVAKKVIFILGSTGTGKSRLAIELATAFSGEIINSDKIQVYRGLDVVTNKVTEEEQRLVKHHLIGVIDDPDKDFTVRDFRREVESSMESILGRGHVPIIAGGSNSYIEALVDEDFLSKYEACFIWIDVKLSVLEGFVRRRVDKMVAEGLVEEVREAFHPDGDYSRGVRRAIGVPEMHQYFVEEAKLDEVSQKRRLEKAIDDIKINTHALTGRQRGKIVRFRDELGWKIYRIDATPVFLKGGGEAGEAWSEVVNKPAVSLVGEFLLGEINRCHRSSEPAYIVALRSREAATTKAAFSTGGPADRLGAGLTV